MSYKSDYSYRRYANYRANKHHYKMNQIAAPIVMIMIIGFFSKYWLPILLIGCGLVALLIYRRYIEETVPHMVKKSSAQRLILMRKRLSRGEKLWILNLQMQDM